MKVLVCGSRSWDDYDRLFDRLAKLPQDTQLIHGGARGADSWASFAAESLFDPPPVEFRADWEAHGKKAGILRNLQMLEEKPDLVIAFWDGRSNGTRHTINEAHKRGITVEVVL